MQLHRLHNLLLMRLYTCPSLDMNLACFAYGTQQHQLSFAAVADACIHEGEQHDCYRAVQVPQACTLISPAHTLVAVLQRAPHGQRTGPCKAPLQGCALEAGSWRPGLLPDLAKVHWS